MRWVCSCMLIVSLLVGTTAGYALAPSSEVGKLSQGLKALPWRIMAARVLPGVAIIIAAISASLLYGHAYVALVQSGFVTGLVVKTLVGAAARGLGSYVSQTIRGETIDWNLIGRWMMVGAFYFGIIIFSGFYPFIRSLHLDPIRILLIDQFLFVPGFVIPFHFVADEWYVHKSENQLTWWGIFEYSRQRYLEMFKYHASFWVPVLGAGWTFVPDHMDLVAANGAIVWSGPMIYLLDLWKDQRKNKERIAALIAQSL